MFWYGVDVDSSKARQGGCEWLIVAAERMNPAAEKSKQWMVTDVDEHESRAADCMRACRGRLGRIQEKKAWEVSRSQTRVEYDVMPTLVRAVR